MKLILLILGVLSFSFEFVTAQTIHAGQTTGEYIHYSDIEDVNLQADSSYTFDFEQDGIADLKISCFWYTTHVGYDKGVIAEPYNNTQICDYPDNPGWSIKYAANAVIGESCLWNTQSSLVREHIWSIMTGESFLGNWNSSYGYFGFRICNTVDTIIGWVGMNTISEESVSIYDYAVYSVHFAAGKIEKPDWEVKYNSLVKDKLIIHITLPFNQNLDYYCLNSLGHEILKGRLNEECNELDLSSFPAGVYFCRISANNPGRYYKVLKFIKE
jgi:hypothetical protein